MPPIGFGDPQAMLVQRNNAMEALERRNRAERERSGSMAGVCIKSLNLRTLLTVCSVLRLNLERTKMILLVRDTQP